MVRKKVFHIALVRSDSGFAWITIHRRGEISRIRDYDSPTKAQIRRLAIVVKRQAKVGAGELEPRMTGSVGWDFWPK